MGPAPSWMHYHPDTVFSSIDRNGRYAYGNQPSIARWNLARLAEAMLPLLDADGKKAVDLANEALGGFEARFQGYWLTGMRAKLGLFNDEEDDAFLVHALLEWMRAKEMDFTNTFRRLSDEAAINSPPFADDEFTKWHVSWKDRLQRQPQSMTAAAQRMRSHNPAVIPRNHKVEEALAAATDHG